MVFTLGMVPAVQASEADVKLRDTAYSETEGLRAAMTGKLTAPMTAFTVTGPEGALTITEVIEGGNNIYTIVTAEVIDAAAAYTLGFGGETMEVRMPIWYSTEAFESRYTYTGDDLGAAWTAEKTTFRVWAPTAEEVSEKISLLPDLDFNVNGFHIAPGANGEDNALVVIFNPNAEATTVTLPEGTWDIRINGEDAGDATLAAAEGSVEVAPISAMVLVQEGEEEPRPTEPVAAEPVEKGNLTPMIVGAVLAAIAIAAFIFLKKKK